MRRNSLVIAAIFILISAALLLSGCATDMHIPKNDYAFTMPQDLKPAPPPCGTIWSGINSNNALFTDKKARYVGDVVTIIIQESSEGANNAKTDLTRNSTVAAGLSGILQTSPGQTILSPLTLGGTHTNNLAGEGKTRRDSSLTANMTARVKSVLDNGNLVIEGRRQLSVNAEDQFIVITGVIRPEDITTDNTISSQYIADARIVYGGIGVVNDKMRHGWLARILDWVWPF
ncbi:MAG: flagellar basal body L-ring protein FlgH [Syntrophales bacterium]